MPKKNKMNERMQRYNRENRLAMESAVNIMNAQKESLRRQLDEAEDASLISTLYDSLRHLERRTEHKILLLEKFNEVEALKENMTLFKEESEAAGISAKEKKQYLKEMKETEKEATQRMQEYEDLDKAEKVMERADLLQAQIASGAYAGKVLEEKKKELQSLYGEEFTLMSSFRSQMQTDERTALGRNVDEIYAGMDQSSTENYDKESVTDRILLGIFADEVYSRLFPERQKKTNAEMRRLLTDDSADAGRNPVSDDDLEELGNILDAVSFYAKIRANGNLFRKDKKDSALEMAAAGYLDRHLNALFERMTEKNTDQSAKNWVPDEQLLAVSSLLNYFEGEIYGKLGSIPEEPESANARHIRFTGEYIHSYLLEGSVLDHYASDVIQEEKKENGESGDQIAQEYILERDYREYPLFAHDPSPADIQQGSTGDCYLLCTLSAIAEKYPEKIKEMMRDNRDGTVTVRLFEKTDDTLTPLYITVDKVLHKGQSNFSVWAGCIEKALAVSGLKESRTYNKKEDEKDGLSLSASVDYHPVPENINEIYEGMKNGTIRRDRGKYPWLFSSTGDLVPWKPNFEAIAGDTPDFAAEVLFGARAASDVSKTGAHEGFTSSASKPAIRLNANYTSAEKKFYEKLKTAFKNGRIVTAGSLSKRDGIENCIDGISRGHGYAVLGVTEKEFKGDDGKTYRKKFVVIRNPHGDETRTYRKVEGSDAIKSMTCRTSLNGISAVELSDFMKEFSNVTICQVKASSVEKSQQISANEADVMKSYADSMREINNYLKKALKGKYHNSGEYSSLKSAISDMTSASSSYHDLQKKLNKLRKTLDAYVEHCRRDGKDHIPFRKEKLTACAAVENVLKAAENGYLRPQEYADAKLAEKMVNTIRSLEGEKAGTVYVNEAGDVILNDHAEAVRRIMKSSIVRTFLPQSTDFVAYSQFLSQKLAMTDRQIAEVSSIVAQKLPEYRKKSLKDIVSEEKREQAVNEKRNAVKAPAAAL